MHHDYWARTLDATCHISRVLQLPKLTYRETVLYNKRSHRSEKPEHRIQERSSLTATREAFTQQQRPSTAKNKSVKLFFLKNKNMISKNSFKKVYPWSPTQPSLLAGHCHLYKPTRQGWCGLTGKKNTWPTYKLTQRYKTNNSLALKFWYCIQHGFFFFGINLGFW